MTQQQSIQLQNLKQQLLPPSTEKTPDTLSDRPPETLAGPDDHVNRPSRKGAFRPVRNGNIRGSIFAFLASAIATGCLNLTLRMQQLGVIPFFIVMSLCCIFSYYGMYLIQLIILKFKVQSYAEMVQRAFGEKAKLYSQIMLILFTWAVAICFQVIFMKFMVQIMADVVGLNLYSDRDKQIYNMSGQFARMISGVLMVVLNYRYLMMTDLREVLNTVGKFSIIGIFFCLGVIYLTSLFGFTSTTNGQTVVFRSVFTMDYSLVEWWQPLNGHYLSVFLQASAAIYFTYLNHQFVYPLISHLKRPTKRRVQGIFFWAHLQQFLIYGILALLSYLLLSQHRDILPISSLVLASIPTPFITLAKVLITAALFFRLPLQIFTTKEFIYQSLDIERNDAHLKTMNIVLTASSLVIAVLFEEVNLYFALIGGTFGVLMGGLIPVACVIKLININTFQLYIVVFVTFMSIVCFLGAIQSVLFPL